MADIANLVDLITRGGLITTLIIALFGGWKEWYVWGPIYKERMREKDEQLNNLKAEKETQLKDITRDRDYWRDQAIRCITSAERVTSFMEATQKKTD